MSEGFCKVTEQFKLQENLKLRPALEATSGDRFISVTGAEYEMTNISNAANLL